VNGEDSKSVCGEEMVDGFEMYLAVDEEEGKDFVIGNKGEC